MVRVPGCTVVRFSGAHGSAAGAEEAAADVAGAAEAAGAAAADEAAGAADSWAQEARSRAEAAAMNGTRVLFASFMVDIVAYLVGSGK